MGESLVSNMKHVKSLAFYQRLWPPRFHANSQMEPSNNADRSLQCGDDEHSETASVVAVYAAPALGSEERICVGVLASSNGGVPDHTALSHRMRRLSVPLSRPRPGEVLVVAVDSTDLKVCGRGERLTRQHGTNGRRRTWRKLHLAVGVTGGAVVAVVTTGINDDGTYMLVEAGC